MDTLKRSEKCDFIYIADKRKRCACKISNFYINIRNSTCTLTFDYPGYDLRFVQKESCIDGSAHKFSCIYKFFSPVTQYIYIVRAEYHLEQVFAVKFYCKKDRRSEYKYSKIINRGDTGNILITCAKVIPMLLQEFPSASFGFIGARTLDKVSGKVESYINNQRFRVYKNVIAQKFGDKTFQHIEYPEVSGYLLINRTTGIDLIAKEDAIKRMFASAYNNLPDI